MHSIVPQTCIKLMMEQFFILFDWGNIDTLDDVYMFRFELCMLLVLQLKTHRLEKLHILRPMVFITDNAQAIQLAMLNRLQILLWSTAWVMFFAVNLNEYLTPVHIGYKLKEQCFPVQPTDAIGWQRSWTLLQFRPSVWSPDNWQWCCNCWQQNKAEWEYFCQSFYWNITIQQSP